MWINDLGHKLAGCRFTPRRFKRYPLGTLMMFFWGLMGLALFEDGDKHPWPYLAWPTEIYVDQADDFLGYSIVGLGMVVSSVMFLVGHAMDGQLQAKFTRWVGLWMAISVSVLMFVGIPLAVLEGYPMKWWWPFSMVIWFVAINAFGWALRIVKLETQNACPADACSKNGG